MKAFEDVEQSEEMIEYFKNFASNPRGFLLLSGKNGTGKTFSSTRILKAHGSGMLFTQADLFLDWMEQIKQWKSVSQYYLEKFLTCKVLVIDDLGTRTPSEAFMDFLYILADKRYSMRYDVGTIVTTNLNAKDMREKFGDAFVSRVASGKIFKFEGNDRRIDEF